MNRKAFKMVSLAAISTFSAAAMAGATLTLPKTQTIPMVKPVAPNVAAPKQALPGTQGTTLKAANDEAVQQVSVGETCDPRQMYADLSAGTTFSPEAAQSFVNDIIIQIAGNNCGKDAASMSRDARQVLLGTASCAQAKGIMQIGDYKTRVEILAGCQAAEKRGLGMTAANDNTEQANVESIIKTCGYYKMAM